MNKKKLENIDADDDILTVQETIQISDGAHSGKISKLIKETRQEYTYLDIYINTKDDSDNAIEIKVGFPYYLSNGSGLGRFLKKAGFRFESGETIKNAFETFQKLLVGKKVIFQTTTETTDKGQFARIIPETVKFD